MHKCTQCTAILGGKHFNMFVKLFCVYYMSYYIAIKVTVRRNIYIYVSINQKTIFEVPVYIGLPLTATWCSPSLFFFF